jgi:D-xylose transport system ATP-binding protein
MVKISRLNKWFGGTHAVRDVSINFEAGEVHAVAGENGAGKSTLVKILSGVYGASSYTGEIEIDSVPRTLHSVRDAEQYGIFLVPQELNIVPELRVGEFLFLNREPRRWGLLDTRKLWSETAHWLSVFKLAISPVDQMATLSPHEQQLVSIARAMTQGSKVLILDEPTASLTERETELMFSRIADLRTHGVATVYISHRLKEFERIADVVTVMRDGSVVDQFRIDGVLKAPQRVVKAMVGRDIVDMYPKVAAPLGAQKLAIRDWSVTNAASGRRAVIDSVSLRVRAGEVLGVFGLIGSGALELARSILGLQKGRATGEIWVDGRPVQVGTPARAIAAGICYLPAERKRDGMVPGMSVGANLSLAALDRFSSLGMIRRSEELRRIQSYIRSLRVKCESPEQPIAQLSGGNQQKVVAAKWLLAEPEVFVLEEPTRGVDVNARIDFYELINELAARGKAVILVSTDLPEVLEMSDRIVVIADGKMIKEWPRGEASEEEIMLHAAGGHRSSDETEAAHEHA